MSRRMVVQQHRPNTDLPQEVCLNFIKYEFCGYMDVYFITLLTHVLLFFLHQAFTHKCINAPAQYERMLQRSTYQRNKQYLRQEFFGLFNLMLFDSGERVTFCLVIKLCGILIRYKYNDHTLTLGYKKLRNILRPQTDEIIHIELSYSKGL